MSDEEIEKALKGLTAIDLTDPESYDSCGRLIPPHNMALIQEILAYIERLKYEKAQAVKEFAEKLKLESYNAYSSSSNDVLCVLDELVKEYTP